MNVSSQLSAATTQVSGAVAIASASSSKTASLIAESSPEAAGATAGVIFNAELIGLCSFVVMLLSFVWNVYSTKKRDKLNAEMKARELELEERKVTLQEMEWRGVNDRRNKK